MFEGYQIIPGAEMRDYTTLKLGGPVDWLALPASAEDVAGLFREAEKNRLPVTVIGHGSNLLVLDGGIRGLVIRMGRGMNRIRTEGNVLRAQAGAMMSAVAAEAADRGLTGLEFASGIPGTIGGGAVMNAGAYGGEMAQVISSVTGVLPGGQFLTLNREQLAFGYRRSAIPEIGMTVTEVVFELTPGVPEAIRAKMGELNRQRAEKQPLDAHSAGSTFKRPEGAFAAALIDQCGLKGYRIGGAMVSTKHAGFLISDGGTAKDFLELIRTVQRIVAERTGVSLEPEIRIIGEE